jgi:hypothetical protein
VIHSSETSIHIQTTRRYTPEDGNIRESSIVCSASRGYLNGKSEVFNMNSTFEDCLVRTEVSEEHRASIIRVIRIGEQGTPLAVTSNRRTLRRNAMYIVFLRSVRRLLVTAIVPNSPILVTLMKEAPSSSETPVLTQEPHSVTSQKTPFFIVTAVKTSNLT